MASNEGRLGDADAGANVDAARRSGVADTTTHVDADKCWIMSVRGGSDSVADDADQIKVVR
jgi:hypothetical protein